MSLTDGSTGTTLTADGPGEFWCPFCQQRCTRNRTSGKEYGHALDCPERPTDLDNPDQK
ncbi:hypothetical protein GJ633_02950 [Halorubrum sp. CBA1125]|uniref:hypothetical protein n=1 Tax=Halorubrum sp. CBA1125 TaxID=2668072 RepID=UPI0012E78CA4|nr:hypothetical protein [Halorubrum sp. CBA1125]MUW13729.1 hypothetical protein [Halorubrum sp. CBA1125]